MISFAEPFCGEVMKALEPTSQHVGLCGELNGRFISGDTQQWEECPAYVVSGHMDSETSAGIVPVAITVPRRLCFEMPPAVQVDVSWLAPCFPEQDQNLLNWHRYSKEWICWTHPTAWKRNCADAMAVGDIWRTVAQMMKDVRVVLNYHWVAFTERLTAWPREWRALPHGFSVAKQMIGG